ncbi:ead/Ea22-like family protein [Escherichia albertii]
MSKIDYQALREIAKQATQGEWVAFISPGKYGTYAVHTPGDNHHGDIVDWPGFDEQKNAENNARYIAAFNPEVVQALLDEREAQSKRIAELEAREILLPERSSMLHRTDFNEDYHTVMAYKVSEVIAAIRAAGIRINGGE